jgi:hypothetical protein
MLDEEQDRVRDRDMIFKKRTSLEEEIINRHIINMIKITAINKSQKKLQMVDETKNLIKL